MTAEQNMQAEQTATQQQPQSQLPQGQPYAISIVGLVQHLMGLPADLLVLNTQHLMFLAPPPQPKDEGSGIIVPDNGIIIL